MGPKKMIPGSSENVNIPWTTLNISYISGPFCSETLGIHALFEHLQIPDFSRLRKRCIYYCFRPGRLCTAHLLAKRFPKPPIAAPAPFPPRDLCPPRGGPVAPRWRTGGRAGAEPLGPKTVVNTMFAEPREIWNLEMFKKCMDS